MKNKTTNLDKKNLIKIFNLISTADHGCKYCCADIFGNFIKMFPERKKEAELFFENKFKISLKRIK